MASHPITWFGIFLILLGVALVALPMLGKYIQLEEMPNWLIYIYHRENFYFVTSPILILISAISLLFFLLTH